MKWMLKLDEFSSHFSTLFLLRLVILATLMVYWIVNTKVWSLLSATKQLGIKLWGGETILFVTTLSWSQTGSLLKGAAIMKKHLGWNKIILNAVSFSSFHWKITWKSVITSIHVWTFRFWSLFDDPEPSYLVKTQFSEKKTDFISLTGQEQERDYRILHSGWLWNDTPKKDLVFQHNFIEKINLKVGLSFVEC